MHIPAHLSIYLPTYLYQTTNLPSYLLTHTEQPTYLPTYWPTYVPTYLLTYLPTILPTYLLYFCFIVEVVSAMLIAITDISLTHMFVNIY